MNAASIPTSLPCLSLQVRNRGKEGSRGRKGSVRKQCLMDGGGGHKGGRGQGVGISVGLFVFNLSIGNKATNLLFSGELSFKQLARTCCCLFSCSEVPSQPPTLLPLWVSMDDSWSSFWAWPMDSFRAQLQVISSRKPSFSTPR